MARGTSDLATPGSSQKTGPPLKTVPQFEKLEIHLLPTPESGAKLPGIYTSLPSKSTFAIGQARKSPAFLSPAPKSPSIVS